MPASLSQFGGVATRRPTVRAIVKDLGLIPFDTGRLQKVAILGQALGGEPSTPLLFSSPTDAEAVLRGGDIVTAIRKVFSPSTESVGASLVYAVRVNVAVQGTLTLTDGTEDVIDLTSVNYGLEENLSFVKVETGTATGTKKVTVGKGTTLYVKDSLGNDSFSLNYPSGGPGSAATVTITNLQLTTTVTGDGPSDLTLLFTQYPTIQDLVNHINGQTTWDAVVLTMDGEEKCADLDDVSAVDCYDAAILTLDSNLQAIVDWFNSGAQPLMTAVRKTGATEGRAMPENIGETNLTGGSEGDAIDDADWQAAIDSLDTEDPAWLVPLDGSSSVHTIVATNVNAVNSNGLRTRRAILGAIAGQYSTTLANYTAQTRALNNDRLAYLSQGYKETIDGVLTTRAPFFTGAIVAGLMAGVQEIGEGVTYKSVNVEALEWNPTIAEQETQLENGILPVEFVTERNFFRVVRGISTWLKDANFHRVEMATGTAIDEMLRRCANAVEPFLGQKATLVKAHQINGKVKTVLNTLVAEEIIVAFQALQTSLTGDVIAVSFQASPVVPINFINITVHAVTAAGQVTVAVDQ